MSDPARGLWAVTGASGFVGQALLRSLAKDGIPVRTLSRRPIATPDHIRADLRDGDALHALVRGASIVVHLGAYVHRAGRADEAREIHEVNVEGTRLLSEAIAAQPTPPFLLFVSTANVYARSNHPIDESSSVAPATLYGQSKLEAERLVLDSPIPAVVLRPAMVFGEGAPGNLARLLAMTRRRVRLEIGGETRFKSIVPVENLVEAIRALSRDQAAGETYNLGGETLAIREIVGELAAGLGVHPMMIPVPLGAARLLARGVDAVLGSVARSMPSFLRLVETYASSAIIVDGKLRDHTSYAPLVDAREALRRVAMASRRVG
jgi:UDP-glucose 4-epimerase